MPVANASNQLESSRVTSAHMSGGRTLRPEESDRVRRALERLREQFPTQKALAQKIRTSQQLVSHVLSGGNAGLALARRLADYEGVSVEDLLGGAQADEGASLIRSRKGWEQALGEAQERWPEHAEALERVGDMRNAEAPDEITAFYVYDMAMLNLKYRARSAAETKQAREEVARERQRRGR